MREFSYEFEENVKTVDEILRVKENFDIIKREMEINSQSSFYFNSMHLSVVHIAIDIFIIMPIGTEASLWFMNWQQIDPIPSLLLS